MGADISYSVFLDILQEIYSGDLPIKSPDHAHEIIGAANYFKLDRLKAKCEAAISESIDIDNAAYILQIAARNEAWQLKSFALEFIMNHYEEVANSKCFDDLDKPLLLEAIYYLFETVFAHRNSR